MTKFSHLVRKISNCFFEVVELCDRLLDPTVDMLTVDALLLDTNAHRLQIHVATSVSV